MKTFISVLSFFAVFNLSAQLDESLAMNYLYNPPLVSPPSEVVASASFPGGQDAFRTYLADQLIYPEEARKYGVEGVVRAEFRVDAAGRAQAIKIISEPGYGCGAEVKRLIEAMPRWYPALENGLATSSRKRNIAIAFRLD
jgi:TonB family protein